MAFTRARLALLAPWWRGSGAPTTDQESAETAGEPSVDTAESTTSADRPAWSSSIAARLAWRMPAVERPAWGVPAGTARDEPQPSAPPAAPAPPAIARPRPEITPRPAPEPDLETILRTHRAAAASTPATVAPSRLVDPGPRAMPPRGPDGRFVRRSASAPRPQPTVPSRATHVPPAALPAAAPAATWDMPAAPPALAPVRPPAPAPAPASAPASVAPPPLTVVGAPTTASTSAEPDRGAGGAHPVRVVLVEDVPEVAAHVRGLLRPQGRFNLVHVIGDGRRAVDEIADLQPDVVLVDALLQGKVSGSQVAERLRAAGSSVGIVAMTVPDQPVDGALADHADAVITLPFGTLDLGRRISEAHAARVARDPGSASRIVSVFSAKGGVGTTTIAYNLATSLATTGLRTLLVDGCLQFGDIRRLLRIDASAPSICDLPTDVVRSSDLADAALRLTAGVEVLLAPPRPELAELVTGRDLERLLGALRQTYQAIVIDTPSNLTESTLALLDASDLIVDVVTADPGTLEITRLITATFNEIGYQPPKVRYLVNRADSVGAAPLSQVASAIGRNPDYTLASDWQLVAASNADGVPFVATHPEAAVSMGVRHLAQDIRALAVSPVAPVSVRQRARLA